MRPKTQLSLRAFLFGKKELEMSENTVRAKFKCTSKTTALNYRGQTIYSYKFNAVVDGSEENKSFFEATPSGSLELGTVKDDVFELGKEYYLDFTPAN